MYGVIVEVFGLDFLKTDCAEQIPKEVRDERVLLALASLVVIAFAPVCEELFFRGFMFTGLARLWGLVPGLSSSALLFSLAHVSYKSFVPIARRRHGVRVHVLAEPATSSRRCWRTVAFNSLSIALHRGRVLRYGLERDLRCAAHRRRGAARRVRR